MAHQRDWDEPSVTCMGNRESFDETEIGEVFDLN